MNKCLFKRNPTLFVAICVALFIPLIIAIVFAFTVDPFELDESVEITSVTIKLPDGNTRSFDSAEAIELFKSMSKNATPVDKDFVFEKKDVYEVSFHDGKDNSTSLVYKFYPSSDVEHCVYVSPDNDHFIVHKDIAAKILKKPEFSGVDAGNHLPALTVTGLGESVSMTPDSYDWTYTAIDGSLANMKNSDGKANNPMVKFDDSIKEKFIMEFSKQPDSLNLTINSNPPFNDEYKNLPDAETLHFEKDTLLTVTAVAEWYELKDSEYYGTATYSFDLLYDVAPTYKLVDNSLRSGDFTILKLTNFNDGELLKITNDIGTCKEFSAYDYKGAKFAFIPVTSKLAEGDVTINFETESGHTSSAKTAVRAGTANYKKQTIIVDVAKEKADNDTQLSDSLTEKSIKDFEELALKLSAKSANEKLFTGDKYKFVYPTGSNKKMAGGAEYGMRRTVTNLNAVNLEYVAHGNDMLCEQGQDIKCANSGKVVFADKTTLLGNTVIVDHGFGILSYYGNLDSISVKQGDSVTRGETVVGKAGSTGFAAKFDGATVEKHVTCHFAVSMSGGFINPEYIVGGIYGLD